MYSLATGEYVVVFELNLLHQLTFQQSRYLLPVVLRVSRTSTNLLSDHSRNIVHLHKYYNVTQNCLMIDMVLKNKAGISDTQDLQVFAVVDLIVWDKIYTVHNGIINFNEKVKIDVIDPVNNKNPVSKRYMTMV